MSEALKLTEPEPRIAWGWSLLAGALATVLVAFPAFWMAAFAYAGFSGCFLECGEPDPAVGVMWLLPALALLSIPVLLARAVARRGRRARWIALAAVVGSLLLGAAASGLIGSF